MGSRCAGMRVEGGENLGLCSFQGYVAWDFVRTVHHSRVDVRFPTFDTQKVGGIEQ